MAWPGWSRPNKQATDATRRNGPHVVEHHAGPRADNAPTGAGADYCVGRGPLRERGRGASVMDLRALPERTVVTREGHSKRLRPVAGDGFQGNPD
jgi:hypothetical protein